MTTTRQQQWDDDNKMKMTTRWWLQWENDNNERTKPWQWQLHNNQLKVGFAVGGICERRHDNDLMTITTQLQQRTTATWRWQQLNKYNACMMTKCWWLQDDGSNNKTNDKMITMTEMMRIRQHQWEENDKKTTNNDEWAMNEWWTNDKWATNKQWTKMINKQRTDIFHSNSSVGSMNSYRVYAPPFLRYLPPTIMSATL